MTVKRILVVDDNQSHIENLTTIIKQTNCEVITAASGQEAVAKAPREMPDLIFMDIIMDDLDGYGACSKILQNEKTQHIPIIFVSAKNNRVDRLWAKSLGAKKIITKPYNDEEILNEING